MELGGGYVDSIDETVDAGCWYAVQCKAIYVALEAIVLPTDFRLVVALVLVGCPPVNANAAEQVRSGVEQSVSPLRFAGRSVCPI